MHALTQSVQKKLAIRFGLAFLLVVFFCISTIRLYTENAATYQRILLMEGADTTVIFSPKQLDYIRKHISNTEDRMLRELVISNIVVVIIFSCLSYLLSQGLLESVTDSMERERRFLDDASHELRTPTAAISTIAETTLRSPSITPTDYRSALENIFEESKRLDSIIKDLLFVSKNDDQGIKLTMERQNLAELVTAVGKKMQIVADLKSIKIETYLPAKETFVTGDRNKLTQLLVVLLDNAIKYSNHNSKIILKLEHKPRIKISVKDFGKGIDTKDLPHIFERFYRSDASRSESGTGLGLSIAQWIAQAHNAKVEARSQKGKGSTFSLIF